jgi:hypothetical protein
VEEGRVRKSGPYEFRRILMRDGKLHKFIIITMIVPFAHDSVTHIGVTGATKGTALREFGAALRRWSAIREKPE